MSDFYEIGKHRSRAEWDKMFDDAEAEARTSAVATAQFNAPYSMAIAVKANLNNAGWDVAMCAPNEDGKAATVWELWLMRGDATGFANAVSRAVDAANRRLKSPDRDLIPA